MLPPVHEMKIDLHLTVKGVQNRPERHVDRRFGLVQLKELVEVLTHIERDESKSPVELFDVKDQMHWSLRIPIVTLFPKGSRLAAKFHVRRAENRRGIIRPKRRQTINGLYGRKRENRKYLLRIDPKLRNLRVRISCSSTVAPPPVVTSRQSKHCGNLCVCTDILQ